MQGTVKELTTSKNEKLQFEQINNFHELESYVMPWNKLSKNFSNPLLDVNWYLAGSKGFSNSSQPAMMLLTTGKGEIKAIAPLASKGKFLPHLEILGTSILREPSGFLYDSENSLKILINSALKLRRPLYLRGLYEDSSEVRILKNKLESRDSEFYSKEYLKIPYVNTNGDWSSFEAGLTSSKRTNIRRLQRKAKKQGEVSFEVITPTASNIDHYLDLMFKIEASNWKGRMGTAIGKHEALHDFFKEYAYLMTLEGKLRLNFMYLDRIPIAAQLAVEYANSLWLFKIGYDEKYRSLYPGILLMNYVVKYCYDNGLNSCEFLGNNDKWLHHWATGVHELVSYRIYPNSLYGRLVNSWDHINRYYHDLRNAITYRWAQFKER